MYTELLSKSELSKAAMLLQKGQLLGIPTETVYGLAANGLDSQAVSTIFQVKGRPSDNPLILHIGDASWLSRYCENIPNRAWRLAEHFWPGPLTLILERKEIVPDIVTAGLSSVGVRCPNHLLALEVIKKADLPLAAPSGNLSGKPSPTTAFDMMEDMKGRIPAVLDGGNCMVGVESTILDVRGVPTLLRFGGISIQEIETVLQERVSIDPHLSKNDLDSSKENRPLAPGMKYRHYAPKAPVTVVIGGSSAEWIASHAKEGDGVICFDEYSSLFPHCITKNLGKENHFTTQAQQVFSVLRAFDHTAVSQIWAQCPKEEGLGQVVANRLQKAAGFKILRLEDFE